jgi:kynurenine 3-monooxygenase
MSRGGLNMMLMDRAEAATPGSVRIAFRQRLVSYDFETHDAVFLNEDTGARETIHAPVIIGTDGSASALRASMKQAGGLELSEQMLDAGYKELTLPPARGDGLGPDGRFALEPNALHIWPRGKFMLIALANTDGSFTCTLFLPFKAEGDAPSFDKLTDTASVSAFFGKYFADVAPKFPRLEEAFLSAPLGNMWTVKCRSWARGTALLMGDAAHAIVPFFGQGMNAGFEDCTLLDEALAKFDGKPVDWSQLFAQFAAARATDTDAIADLAVENFVEMRDKVADPTFLLHRAVEGEIQKRFPGRYLTRYQLVTFSRVPYSVALEAGRIQAELLGELCQSAKSAADVDYSRADVLLRERLEPFLRAKGVMVGA